jgi:hypothetical protein
VTRGAVFSRIYRTNGWNGRESRSGPGSGRAATRKVAAWLDLLLQEYRVRSLLNIGCGDDLWVPTHPAYLGIDVAPEAVSRASRFHPDRNYEVRDAVDGLPPGEWDAVLIRDVLQHLPLEDGLRLLDNVMEAGVRLLIASTYTGPSVRHGDPANVDIRVGDCYSPVLTAAPFHLAEPRSWTPDGYDYRDGEALRDPAKRLALWVLR